MVGPVLFVLTCAGLACAVRGIVGARIGDEPHCAACRYDLSGVEMESDFCPECGAAIGPAGSVVVGKRRPIWWLTLAGLLLSALGLSGVAIGVWSSTTGYDWIRARSFQSLIDPVEQGVAPNPRENQELMRRLAAGALSEVEVSRLVRAAASQRSSSALWLSRVGAMTPLLSNPEDLEIIHTALLETYMEIASDDRVNPEAMLVRSVIESEYASGRLRESAAYFRTLVDVAVEVDPVASGQGAVRYAVSFRQLPTAESPQRAVVVRLECASEGFSVSLPPSEARWDLDWHVARARGERREWVSGLITTSLPPQRYDVLFEATVTLTEEPLGRAVEFTVPVRREVVVLPEDRKSSRQEPSRQEPSRQEPS